MKKIGISLLILLLPVFVSGCANSKSVTRDIFAMDTYMSLTFYGSQAEEAAEAAVQEIYRLDALWSVGDADSEVSRLNRQGSLVISTETAELLETALQLYKETGGALDITVYPLMELWGFTGKNPAVPSDEAILETLPRIGADRLQYDASTKTLTLGADQQIDFGAIAKGYTSARLMELADEYHLRGALVSLGGNVQCMGKKPDGTAFHIGIQDPESDGYLGILALTGKAVVTSGGYERFFEENGETYHHILDPHTGYPARSGLSSASIISEDGTLADAVSTACFVMGEERSIAYWREHAEDFDMILYTEDGRLLVTKPLSDSFSSERDVIIIQ